MSDLVPTGKTTCESCGQREATEKWVGEGGWYALTVGAYKKWCEICVLQAQLALTQDLMNKVPERRQRLYELLANESKV